MAIQTNIFRAGVNFLNSPLVKEGIKNVAGGITCILGLVELYDLCQIMRGQESSTAGNKSTSTWAQTAQKAITIAAKLSLILSAGVSRPGVYVISTLIGQFATTAQLESVFGANTVFAINPWHPRHVISLVAVGLAMPAVIQGVYKGICWIFTKKQDCQKAVVIESKAILSDSAVYKINFFNFMTSRPTLHIGNWIARIILRRM